jgi:hypothetical protein
MRFRFMTRALGAAAIALSLSACGGGGISPSVAPSQANGASNGTAVGQSSSNGSAGGSSPASAASNAPNASASASAGIIAGPGTINVGIGSAIQIGVLDPNYNGAFTVRIDGGGLLPTLLNTVSNLVDGLLPNNGNGGALLTLNIAGVTGSLLGSNGDLVTICEQQSSDHCTTVNLSSVLSSVPFAPSLSSVALLPGQSVTLAVSTLSGLLGGSGAFNVVSSTSNLLVSAAGGGNFTISAPTGVSAPNSGTLTISDGSGRSIAIPAFIF